MSCLVGGWRGGRGCGVVMSSAPENQLKPNFQRDKESRLGAEDRGGRSDPTIEKRGTSQVVPAG